MILPVGVVERRVVPPILDQDVFEVAVFDEEVDDRVVALAAGQVESGTFVVVALAHVVESTDFVSHY